MMIVIVLLTYNILYYFVRFLKRYWSENSHTSCQSTPIFHQKIRACFTYVAVEQNQETVNSFKSLNDLFFWWNNRCISKIRACFTYVAIGVRGGGREGRPPPPPGLKIFRTNSVFRASASCSKRKFSIQWKIPGQFCFSGQVQVAQIFWIINYTYSVQWSQGNSVFQGKRKLLKNSQCKWNISGQVCFSG